MSHSDPSTSKNGSIIPKKILLQVTGSIAAFKAAALCSKLVQLGHEVEVILSEGASQFIGAATFEGLTRKKVHQGLYDAGTMMAHIDLERWADVILLYPASANTIAKMANGQAENLITSLFLAHEFKKPYLLAPAMNQAMFKHPATQANLNRLASWGVQILAPTEGHLACGETGAGRLIEPEAMLDLLDQVMAQEEAKTKKPEVNRSPANLSNPSSTTPPKKILITSGGTTEPIDAVRSITNFSTGETGYRLSEALKKAGHSVTLLQSKLSKFESPSQSTYLTTDDFAKLLKQKLETESYDYLIHAAAVADYRVDPVSNGTGNGQGKIQSEAPVTLNLKPNPKVIQSVRQWSRNPNLHVISFKLTADSAMKLENYDSEWIIHNELREVKSEQHRGTIYNRDRQPTFTFETKSEMTGLVQSIIEGAQS
jgi:phosphopantothenoylcysteine decarboxylase/phosphopantothenate--cysteine ligase